MFPAESGSRRDGQTEGGRGRTRQGRTEEVDMNRPEDGSEAAEADGAEGREGGRRLICRVACRGRPRPVPA